MHSQYQKFEDLVRRILSINGFSITTPSLGQDRGFDFVAQIGNETWAIEVKFYRTRRAQASLIKAAALRLNHSAVIERVTKGMLIVSCYIPAELRHEFERAFNVTMIDGADLANWASRDLLLLGELQSMLDSELEDSAQVGRAMSKSALGDIPLTKAKIAEDTQGTDLCQELRRASRGKSSWAAYERLCEKILRYLFPSDLHGWHKQKRTDDGLNRFDFVCRIQPATDFWQFLMHHLHSRYVIFEFKNYTGKIKQGQILTTEKYLLEKALRRVAIIFCRVGAEKDAMKMTQGAMREHGKLMLVLDDEKVCQMLHMKERGEDPTDYLFDIADDFLLTLPR